MKKLCTILAALSLVLLCFVLMPNEAQAAEIVESGTCGDNLTWTLDSEGTLTISGSGEMAYYMSSYYIPWCDYWSSIKTVVIPSGLTSIDRHAFSECTKLAGIWVAEGNSYYSSDSQGILFNKDKSTLIKAPNMIADGYSIPDSVTSIG